MATQLKAQEARDRVAELEAELASIRAVEVVGASMPWTTVEYPNGEVDLDVAGNIVGVRVSGLDRLMVVES